MKSFIRNTIVVFERLVGVRRLTTTDNSADVVVSGHGCLLTKKRLELSLKRCSHRQVGILYADIADYSRLTEQDEEGTHLLLVERMNLMEAYVSANNGRVAHFAGDAILAEFEDADNALNCAINMQLSDHRRNIGLDPNQQIQFRMGVHFGDVIADRGDIYGNAVNLTARLEKLAHSGGICVSESVRRRLNSNPSFKFISIGEKHLKNLSDPVTAFRIELGVD